MVRDPLAMLVAGYYSWRDCACRTHGAACRGHHQRPTAAVCALSIDDAYARRAPPIAPAIGVFTRFFCGQGTMCKAADPQPAAAREEAYRRAAYHLRHQ